MGDGDLALKLGFRETMPKLFSIVGCAALGSYLKPVGLETPVAPITSAEQDEDALVRQAIAWSLQPAVAPITSAEQDKDALVRQAISLSLQPAVAPNASAELDKDAMKRQAVAFSLQPAVLAGPSVEQHGDASLCQAAISIPAGLGLSHCSRY